MSAFHPLQVRRPFVTVDSSPPSSVCPLLPNTQENGGGGGMSTRSGGGRWGGGGGGSGVAAMRAEHEAEMTALKEEKQDLLLKYHTTSSELNKQERRCAELGEEVEEIRAQLVSLQVRRSIHPTVRRSVHERLLL